MIRAGLARIIPALFLVGGMLTSVATAEAQAYTHDGFFLRLAGGFGYSDLSENDTDQSVHGGSFGMNVAIGGMVIPNLAIHGTLSGMSMFDPSVSNGITSVDLDDTTVGIGGLGAGVTYYFMPINLYISGSLLLAQAHVDVNGIERDSDVGLMLNTVVGKEWWIHQEWGIGVAGMLDLGTVPHDNSDDSSTVVGFHVLFTATYN